MEARERGPLTEAMFYTLMVLARRDVCGTEIAQAVAERTAGRVKLGPGTLYTILARFLEEKYIRELETDLVGRKRTYQLTETGRAAYQAELRRLRQCVLDAEEDL